MKLGVFKSFIPFYSTRY